MQMKLAIAAFFGLISLGGAIAQAATIDFNTLPGTYESSFKSYTENGFTVATHTGGFLVDPANFNTAFGNPAPDIFSESNMCDCPGDITSSLIITKAGGGTFTFDSVDLAIFGNEVASVEFVGSLGGKTEYDVKVGSDRGSFDPSYVTGSSTNVGLSGFQTVDPGETSESVSSVVVYITTSDPLVLQPMDVDNIVLDSAPSSVPEPSNVVLLGLGMLVLGALVHRRSAGNIRSLTRS